mmetsp:Transcript_20153/g.50870  ORF Transcript_20153/g.50870 Transcript_20153/m.50870 type:complete len:249 (-) Transcript_20153:294-1040(-)
MKLPGIGASPVGMYTSPRCGRKPTFFTVVPANDGMGHGSYVAVPTKIFAEAASPVCVNSKIMGCVTSQLGPSASTSELVLSPGSDALKNLLPPPSRPSCMTVPPSSSALFSATVNAVPSSSVIENFTRKLVIAAAGDTGATVLSVDAQTYLSTPPHLYTSSPSCSAIPSQFPVPPSFSTRFAFTVSPLIPHCNLTGVACLLALALFFLLLMILPPLRVAVENVALCRRRGRRRRWKCAPRRSLASPDE